MVIRYCSISFFNLKVIVLKKIKLSKIGRMDQLYIFPKVVFMIEKANFLIK